MPANAWKTEAEIKRLLQIHGRAEQEQIITSILLGYGISVSEQVELNARATERIAALEAIGSRAALLTALERQAREMERLRRIETASRKLASTKPGAWAVQVDGELFNELDALAQGDKADG